MIRRRTREHRVSDDPYARHRSDIDLTHGMHESTAVRAGAIMAMGIVLILLFNAQGLAKWSQGLPQNPVADWIVLASFQWEIWMKALGTAEIFETLRQAFYSVREIPSL